MNIPDGWPTDEMIDAGAHSDCGMTPEERFTYAFKAALSAAPTPPEEARWVKLGTGEYRLTPCSSNGVQLLVIEPVAESHPIGMADASEQDRAPFFPTEKDTVISFGNVESAIFFRDQVQSCVTALSAAPTPPEVEPIGYVNPRIISILNRRSSTDATIGAVKTTIYSEPLFTSPPSPKASWDAEGNPLNLEAAARDAVDFYDHGVSIHEQRILVNLRKFLKD